MAKIYSDPILEKEYHFPRIYSSQKNHKSTKFDMGINCKMHVDLGVHVSLSPYGHGIVVGYVAGSKPTRWEIKLDNGSSIFSESKWLSPWQPTETKVVKPYLRLKNG